MERPKCKCGEPATRYQFRCYCVREYLLDADGDPDQSTVKEEDYDGEEWYLCDSCEPD